MRNHQSHKVVDIRKDKKNKYEALISGLSDLRRELHQSKAKIVFSMNEVDKQFADTLGTLKAAKAQTIQENHSKIQQNDQMCFKGEQDRQGYGSRNRQH